MATYNTINRQKFICNRGWKIIPNVQFFIKLEVGQEAAEHVHKKISPACAKNGGGGDKEGSKPTVIHIKTGNVCLYNITLRRVHAITVAVEKQ